MNSTPRRRCNAPSDLTFCRRNETATDLIDVCNRLQNILTSKGRLHRIPLPQIVVQGGQSAGKSGVLESIIGRDFLPRGTGTVTRRPTVIQLQPSDEVYAEFLHRGNEKFTDFEKVKQEIIDETMRDPGPNGFSSKPISLKIYAPNVLKLTLVDMPGHFKNLSPDMPEGSVEQVEKMIMEYIGQPNSIILAVSAANQDIFTSEAITIANKADPKHERTLCVLTKLDLMDRGTDARDILENRVLPLAKGYIGVVNRSQEDVDSRKDLQASLLSEKQFFENHQAYSHMADKQGSAYLQKRLQLELIEHIRKTLPSIRRELASKLCSFRKELKKLDQVTGFNNDEISGAQLFMQELVQKFIADMETNLFGFSEHVCRDSLKAGVIINFKMQSELQDILKWPAELTEEEIIHLIANMHGTRNILSNPSITLEAACGSILEQYRDDLEVFVDSIASILISAVEDSCIIIIGYPALKEEVVRYIHESIDRASEQTKDLLGKYLDAEMKFCNIYHCDFSKSKWEGGLACKPVIVWHSDAEGIDSGEDHHSLEEGNQIEDNEKAVNNLVDDLESFSESISAKMKKNDNMRTNAKNLLGIVTEYIRLVQKQIADLTLKVINCFLVHQVFDFIKSKLMIKLLNSSSKDSILVECEEVFKRRNELLDLCADLDEALVAVQSF